MGFRPDSQGAADQGTSRGEIDDPVSIDMFLMAARVVGRRRAIGTVGQRFRGRRGSRGGVHGSKDAAE
jgi:hypothetical protein